MADSNGAGLLTLGLGLGAIFLVARKLGEGVPPGPGPGMPLLQAASLPFPEGAVAVEASSLMPRGISIATHVPSRGELAGGPLDAVNMGFVWPVRNVGGAAARAGLRLNLQTDGGLSGDVSQLLVQANGTYTGPLAQAAVITANFPASIGAGQQLSLAMVIDIPLPSIIDRQASVFGFNWWIFELTVWNLDDDQLITLPNGVTQARHEVRNWVKFFLGPLLQANNLPDPTAQVVVIPG